MRADRADADDFRQHTLYRYHVFEAVSTVDVIHRLVGERQGRPVGECLQVNLYVSQ